jgi:hypothetical protein
MFMKFGWGDNPDPKQMKYIVTSYSLSLDTGGDTTQIGNCRPGEICFTIEIADIEKNPAAEFLGYAADQHNTASEKGAGKISVFQGENVKESIQEISFKHGWITDLDLGSSIHDSASVINLRIAAAEVTVSGIAFEHLERKKHFTKKK